jgi:hypothetical protein
MPKERNRQLRKPAMDSFSASILYLRLWKLVDVQLSRTSASDPVGLFDVIPLDEGKLIKDLRNLVESELSWADNPAEVRSDIKTVLKLYDIKKKNQEDIVRLQTLRKKFQDYALNYSADVKITRATAS